VVRGTLALVALLLTQDAWMAARGGIVYVVHPANVPLPSSPGGNW
jgi:hypothetical protein